MAGSSSHAGHKDQLVGGALSSCGGCFMQSCVHALASGAPGRLCWQGMQHVLTSLSVTDCCLVCLIVLLCHLQQAASSSSSTRVHRQRCKQLHWL